jgi:hypothetical protein
LTIHILFRSSNLVAHTLFGSWKLNRDTNFCTSVGKEVRVTHVKLE